MVRVSEDLRQSVVFLGGQKAGPIDEAPIDPRGVGFLLSGREQDGGGTYLVTAKHVAEKLPPPFVIRFNQIGGGSRLHHIERPEHIRWFHHPDETVDLTVAPIERPDWSDNLRYHLDDVIKYDYVRRETGPGDTVYINGLFYFVHGSKRNRPVLYRGSVALVPGDERIPINGTHDVEGYLIQANPISGCSGSPVWVTRGIQIDPPPNNEGPLTFWVEGQLSLLGFWSSSWKVKNSEIVSVAADDDRNRDEAPLGMGVVVPANKLIEIFEQTDVAKERREMHKKRQNDHSATHDFRDLPPPKKGNVPPRK